MKFSFEVPIKYLKELDECQDYIYILAHMLKNKKYFRYVSTTTKKTILDNSAHELGESININEFLKWCYKLNPDIIILPDKLFDRITTDKWAKLFLKEYKGSSKLMKVVQGNDIREYILNFCEVQSDNAIDIIGISMSRRIIVPNLSYLMTFNERIKPIHLLGCVNPLELLEAKNIPNINTIDTGLPINFAIQNLEFPLLKKNKEWKRISGKDLDYDKEISIDLMKKNIRRFKRYYYEAD